jgi:hypothetical protein
MLGARRHDAKSNEAKHNGNGGDDDDDNGELQLIGDDEGLIPRVLKFLFSSEPSEAISLTYTCSMITTNSRSLSIIIRVCFLSVVLWYDLLLTMY